MTSSPCIILCRPQLGENIGAAARAMKNFGLAELRLVAPRDGWPNEKAEAMAAGASDIVASARVFETLHDALADLNLVYAATARERGFTKPILTPTEAAGRLLAAGDTATGLLFGNERAGLDNEDISLADAIITIPTAEFSSLNLGQAVLIVCFEWFRAGDKTPAERLDHGPVSKPASREEMFQLFDHLEGELMKSGFLYPPDKKPPMIRNIRAMLHRASLTDQEVRTLRGMIVALTKGKHREKKE